MELGRIYLDKEKDIIIDLYKDKTDVTYRLSTPNHHTGNLITNLAKLCHLPISFDESGLKIIEGSVPCYIDTYNQPIYILRLGGIKVANIHEDGTIEMKAAIPAISKTLMSQTKHYNLSLSETLMKSYILSSCKFKTDLHTHMNANLSPDLLIALGIMHQINYPLYYIKKLNLRLSPVQEVKLAGLRELAVRDYQNSTLKGKYLDRKIDDHTYINFADLILHNLPHASYNIPKIRASLSIMKDGQAVFTNVEKVYLYRYVFTKGTSSQDVIALEGIDQIPDQDIRQALQQMMRDHQSRFYARNSLFQDKLLWIARTYQSRGVDYVEISDTTLVKKQAAKMLKEVHEVMPQIIRETGVLIRFLAGIRRIPLTIVRDDITPNDYLRENMQVLKAVASDPYVAGSDILGEEINDIREVQPVIEEIVKIAKDEETFVVRIHAGENDSLRDNVANSIACVVNALAPKQKMPRMRIGHGLYTSNLKSAKGKALLKDLINHHVTLEFQMTSNIRLNNLSLVSTHPLKQYLKAGVACVQGTDGCGLYGTDSMDEQCSLENLLKLTIAEQQAMCESEAKVRAEGRQAYADKLSDFQALAVEDVEVYYAQRIVESIETHQLLIPDDHCVDAREAFAAMISELPSKKMPIIIMGGSFNNDIHRTITHASYRQLIDDLLDQGNPESMYFIIGHELKGYEKYLVEQNHGRYQIYAFVPSRVTEKTIRTLIHQELQIRVALEPVSMGLYKSIAYEVFKRRTSILLAFDGNSAGVNMIQEAKNAKKKCRTFINSRNRMFKEKAQSLRGYITLLDLETAQGILKYVKKKAD